MTQLVIVGAGAFGREVHELMLDINEAAGEERFNLLGYIDDAGDVELLAERGLSVLGGDDLLTDLPPGTEYVVAINDPAIRRAVDTAATAAGLTAAVLVHPRAEVGRYRIDFGPGTIVCTNTALTTNIRTGRHVHVNVNSAVGHDSVLGDYVTINPGAIVSGNVHLGDEVLVGAGASIIQGVSVGESTIVGMGSVVTRDLPARVTAFGAPAKPIWGR